MKNLIGTLKNPFLRRMALIVTVSAVLIASFSCKHDKSGGNNPKPKVEEVTITFVKGKHIIDIEHNNDKVAKGTSLKASDLKKKIGKITYDTGYDFDKLCSDAENGTEITENSPLVVNKNTSIYVIAKKEGSTPQPSDVALTSIKVAGKSIPIADVIDAGSTKDAEVTLEFATDPDDATLTFNIELKTYDSATKKGTWALEVGKKLLKIAVTKGNKTKSYDLKLERLDQQDPSLDSLTVDGKSIASIVANPDVMTALPTEKDKVKIEYTNSPAGCIVTFNPPLANEEWTGLQDGENELSIAVTKGAKKKEYTLKITKLESEGPKLTSISIGPYKKDGDGIIVHKDDLDVVEIPIPTVFEGIEYPVVAVTDPMDAQVEYEGLETGNKVKFKPIVKLGDLEEEFIVKVTKDNKTNRYKIKVIMMTHGAGIKGARYMGEDTSADLNTIERLLKYENVTATICGDVASILFGSRTRAWKTVLINGANANITPPHGSNYAGIGGKYIPMKLGESQEIEVIISNSEWENGRPKEPWLATEKFKFTLACSDKKADAFINKIYVNDENITNEEDDEEGFTGLFAEEAPQIESGKKNSIVVVELLREVESVRINTQLIEGNAIQKVKDDEGEDVYRATSSAISVDQVSGTLVTIVVTPKTSDTNYRETTMKFKLTPVPPEILIAKEYIINGTLWYNMPPEFRNALKAGENPPCSVNANKLAINLVFDDKPKKVVMDIAGTKVIAEGAQIKEEKKFSYTVYTVNMIGDIDATQKQVTLKFEPDDETAFSKGEWKFLVTGTDTKPKIAPIFEEIYYDKNLSDDFLSKLTTGEKPVHKVQGNVGSFVITLTDYEHDFLLDNIHINGEEPNDKEFIYVRDHFASYWRLEQKFSTRQPKDIKIEFFGKANVADTLIWEFRIEKDESTPMPSVPRKEIEFGVGRYGSHQGTPFTDEFLTGIKKETIPTIELYGKEVRVFFDTNNKDFIKEVKFYLDDAGEVTEAVSELNYKFHAEHTFHDVPTGNTHKVTAIIKPASNFYGELKYEFNIKILDQLPEHESYIFAVDGFPKPNGYKATINKDFATILFQVTEDVVEEVKIGKGILQDSDKVTLVSFKNSAGKTIYHAIKEVELSTTTVEDWTIEVTPRDKASYANPVKCVYKLQGKEIDENNASFVIENDKPKIKAKANYKAGMESNDTNEYGAESIDFTAYTMAKMAKVKGIRVHSITNEDMQGESEVVFTKESDSRRHTGKIEAYSDKPTKVKLWSVGKNNSTDIVHGIFKTTLNPIPLWWSYKKTKSVYRSEPAYAEIKVSKNKMTGKRIYLLFAPWEEDYGFRVEFNAVGCSEQSPLVKVGSEGAYQDLYRTSLDVSKINSGESKEVWCKLVHIKTNKEAITYKVKVTVED